MKKEEILVEQLDMEYHSASSDLLARIDNAMDEYAQQEAIAFKNWCDKYESSIANFHEEFFTTEQLYKKYREETT